LPKISQRFRRSRIQISDDQIGEQADLASFIGATIRADQLRRVLGLASG
jgi:hypothetical protein